MRFFLGAHLCTGICEATNLSVPSIFYIPVACVVMSPSVFFSFFSTNEGHGRRKVLGRNLLPYPLKDTALMPGVDNANWIR